MSMLSHFILHRERRCPYPDKRRSYEITHGYLCLGHTINATAATVMATGFVRTK